MRCVVSLVLGLAVICGCSSRIPEPVTYPYSQQSKMQASHHWDVLAYDLSNRINNELIRSDNIEKAVFVEQTCGDEEQACAPHETPPFNEAFRDLLITNLVGFGIPTKNKPDTDAIDILYKVQVVRHHTKRTRSLQPGMLTGLSSAIVVLRNAPAALMTLAAGVAADVANSSLAISGHYEVIITTSMILDKQYIFRASDIYYINDKDFWHYEEQLPQTKTIRLTSSAPEKTERETKETPKITLPPPEDNKKEAL